MFRQAVFRRPLSPLLHQSRILRRHVTEPASQQARIQRLESRLPRFLSRFITPLRTAPISHISAFLILHELTAIVPLFGLAAAFHYYPWLPPYISELKWFKDGMERFGSYARKKGWVTDETRSGRWFGRGQSGVGVVVELATAWAVVKMLLPLRLVVSVWFTPWFARWTVLPVMRRVRGLFAGRKGAKGVSGGTAVASPGAGTGAVGGGVLPNHIKAPLK